MPIDPKGALDALRGGVAGATGRSASGGPMPIVYLAAILGDWKLALTAMRDTLGAMPEASMDVFALELWMPNLPRNNESFKSVMRDFGLVDYWRSSGKWGDFCKPTGKDDFECH